MSRVLLRATPYVLALAAVFVALALIFPIRTQAQHTLFTPFVPAILFSAWYGGMAPGLFSAILSVVVMGRFLLPSGSTVTENLGSLAVALLVAAVTATVTSRERRLRRALEKSEAAAHAARGEAEAANREKDVFLASVAHEIRQPLNAMMPAIELLRRVCLGPDAPDTARRTLDVTNRQLIHLGRIAEDLLNASRLVGGHMALEKRRIDARNVVAHTSDAVDGILKARGHRLLLSVPEKPVTISADPDRLHQVLLNLLNNAIRYTPANGEIHLSVGATDYQAVISVKDTGQGIAEQDLSRIFDLFTRATTSDGGFGVGLYVVRKLVEMHGGKVEARSEGLGKGSEFVVSFPLAAR